MGDDFSTAGAPEAKERAKKHMTNTAVNTVVTGEVFRPIEGNDNQCEHFSTRKDKDETFGQRRAPVEIQPANQTNKPYKK